MASPNRNHEDRANKSDLKIPPIASPFERKMLENTVAQTQTLQAMAPTMVQIYQCVTKQASLPQNCSTGEEASLPQNCSTTPGDNYSVPSALLPSLFDEEKILAIQAQVL